MKKDVIYIDIDDDIAVIIDKLKNSAEKIVALVPPKGNAVLQSVVNLKLLKRAANTAKKQPVIVTSNHALTALAGGLELYVAKNLQSKPVLASKLADEVLEDEEVEVSDEADAGVDAGAKVSLADANKTDDEVELSGEELAALEAADSEPAAAAASAEATPKKAKKDKKDKGSKIPNFDNFRKKLLVAGAAIIVLIVVLLLIFGRTRASITIRAETTPVDVAFDAKFNANSANSDPSTYNLKAISQETKKTLTQAFTATGQKDLGTKASGTVRFTKCNINDLLSGTDTTVPAGTGISSGDLTFVTQSAVTVSPSNYTGFNNCNSNKPSAPVSVVAQNNGDNYNLSARNYSVSGFSTITGAGSQMSGGTSNIVKVISQDDIDKATTLINQQDTSQVKSDLKKTFSQDTLVLDDSFLTTLATVTSSPALGEQANDAKLTAEATYSILGVSNQDIGSALDAYVTTQMTNKDQQRVYDNGLSNIKLEKGDVNVTEKTATYKVSSAAQYGPQFDIDSLKTQVKGKKFGEAKSYLQGLPGVKGVDISLSPFWAQNLPNPGRTKIKLDVDKNTVGQ